MMKPPFWILGLSSALFIAGVMSGCQSVRRLTTTRTSDNAFYVDNAALQGIEEVVRGDNTVLKYSRKTTRPGVAHATHYTVFWLEIPSMARFPIGERVALPDSAAAIHGYTFGGGQFIYDFSDVTGTIKRYASASERPAFRLRLKYTSPHNHKKRLSRRVTFQPDSAFFQRKKPKSSP